MTPHCAPTSSRSSGRVCPSSWYLLVRQEIEQRRLLHREEARPLGQSLVEEIFLLPARELFAIAIGHRAAPASAAGAVPPRPTLRRERTLGERRAAAQADPRCADMHLLKETMSRRLPRSVVATRRAAARRRRRSRSPRTPQAAMNLDGFGRFK